jgi:hypothetical protein
VWAGNIEATGTISAKYEPALIEALLDHFGQAYDGPPNLAK